MSTYRIADIGIGNATGDCSYSFEHAGRQFEVQRFGACFSVPYLKDLIFNLRNSVDAISISDIPRPMKIRDKTYVHRQYLEVMSQPCTVPLCDGGQLKELAVVNALTQAIQKNIINPEKGIFFPLSLMHLEAVYALQPYWETLAFGDSFSTFGVPWVAKPSDFTALTTKFLLNFAGFRDLKNQTPISRNFIRKLSRSALGDQIKKYQYIFSDVGLLSLFREDLEFIRGKDVIVTSDHVLTKDLQKYEPRSIINLFPENFRFHKHINYGVLDAALRITHDKTTPLSLEEWQNLLSIDTDISQTTRRYVMTNRPSVQSRVTHFLQKNKILSKDQVKPDFAFIVHPLSREHLFKHPLLKPAKNIPLDWKKTLEKAATHTPGFTYGRINHIVSQKNNREINGIIYGLLSTPKMMMTEDPEVTYKKLIHLCNHAADMGAKIIGLGAYTKVIGDSGETVNKSSPIPVTTGNSLSASATLWAVYDVVKRMGLLKLVEGSNLVDGTATVIGATGSIGKVSAKLLGLAFKKLCLVAPRRERLEELAREIQKINPQCEVVFSTDANDFAQDTDVLVTATSAFDQKIVDVEKLKPGCVVCDCSRPLDFTEEDAAKRPDVLIIESGEVILPGPVEMTCDLGLPDNSVYACLGETALLALEELYEPFTLGRNIDWVKVKRIYKMAQDHGVKLAAIRGHSGFISEKEIQLTKHIALERRGCRK